MSIAWRQLVRLAACAIAATVLVAMTAALTAADVSGEAEAPPTPTTATGAQSQQAASAVPAPTTAAKDPLEDVPSYGAALVRMVVVLVSILVALLLLARFLPRWLGRPASLGRGDAIKVIDSLSLEPRKRIYLIKVGEQFFLVGTSETGVHMLADKALDPAALPGGLTALNSTTTEAMTTHAGPAAAMRTFAAALSGKAPTAPESEGAR